MSVVSSFVTRLIRGVRYFFGGMFLITGIPAMFITDFAYGTLLLILGAIILPEDLLEKYVRISIKMPIKVRIFLAFLLLLAASDVASNINSLTRAHTKSSPNITTGMERTNTPISSIQVDDGLVITTPVESLIPPRNTVPSEFESGGIEKKDINAAGFIEGVQKKFHIIKSYGGLVAEYQLLWFSAYKFTDANNAKQYYNNTTTRKIEKGGYSQVYLSSDMPRDCFVYTKDYGEKKVGHSWCRIGNVVLEVYYLTNDMTVSDANIKSTIKKYTELFVKRVFNLAAKAS